MPRSKQGLKRPLVSKTDMERAVDDILKNRVSFREAAKVHNVSRHTLMRHVKKFRESNQENFEYIVHYDVNRIFTKHEEAELVSYLKQAARLHYGLTLYEVRSLAFQYAQANEKKYPDKWNAVQLAGKSWLRGFRKRFENELSLRKPEATSLGRSTGFNKLGVTRFFNNYKKILERRGISSERIWNCDETGITTVHVPPKVLAPKGVKQIGSITSGERGTLVTMIAAISSIGNSVPPMLIFPRVNFKDFMMKGAPPGAIGAANSSGWSNEQLFLKFLDHFIRHSKPSTDDPVILIMDNHESHVSIPAIIKCKEAGVILLTFHPHTSHKMQPLDLGVFGPFKTFYNSAVNDWMLSPENAGKPMTIYEIAEMVGKAYPLSFVPKNIISGFRASGIVPLNQDIFGEEDFLPSLVTDRPIPEANNIDETLKDNTEAEAGPSTSFSRTTAELDTDDQSPSFTSSFVSPEAVKPFPKAAARKSANRGKPKGKSRILTDTPEKEELEEVKRMKDLKKQKVETVKRKFFKKKPAPARAKSSSDESDDMEFSSNSDDDISLTDEVNAQQLEQQLETESISEGEFLLVKLCGKKSIKYYVAKVLTVKPEMYITYLDKVPGTNKFLLKNSAQSYVVDEKDVILKLPPPMTTVGSARQQSYYRFSVDFSSYAMN